MSMAPESEVFSFGIPGVDVRPGDHICCFYRGEQERDNVLLPFLRAGIEGGDKCICLIDGAEPADIERDVGRDTGDELDVRRATEAYLHEGRFSRERMIGFLDETMQAVFDSGGYRLARAAGEMTWVLRKPPGVDELFDYERRINGFAPKFPQVLLCMYDLDLFGGGMLIDAIKTHPKVLVDGLLVENPWYSRAK
jgi:hypothetical protein